MLGSHGHWIWGWRSKHLSSETNECLGHGFGSLRPGDPSISKEMLGAPYPELTTVKQRNGSDSASWSSSCRRLGQSNQDFVLNLRDTAGAIDRSNRPEPRGDSFCRRWMAAVPTELAGEATSKNLEGPEGLCCGAGLLLGSYRLRSHWREPSLQWLWLSVRLGVGRNVSYWPDAAPLA